MTALAPRAAPGTAPPANPVAPVAPAAPAPRQLLFVDDEPAVLSGLRHALREHRHRWSMRFAQGGAEALAFLAEQPADVVVTDMRMPGMDGLALLAQVKAGWPDAARVVLSGYADLAAVAQASAVAHQYLLKPCDAATLVAVVERAIELQDVLCSEALRRTVGAMGSLPAVPRVYQRLTLALGDPDVEVKQLAGIVQQDLGMATRVLQFVNSAYYGLAHQVASIEGAIVYIGTNTLRHLALTLEVQASFAGAVRSAELARFERHAALTARLARRMVGDPVRGEVAFAAGLLHDAGKLVLLDRLPGAYAEAGRRAAAERRPQIELEREVVGADHAAVGAYLLGLWGLPHAILEAVAFHHDESRLARGGLDTVEAVGAANLLAHAASKDHPAAEEAPQALARLMAGSQAAWAELADRELARLDQEERGRP
ncbi:MAG: HDOD domain-containing protein [Anaeromyxobacter sp.]|nr:HDOD domain-containing protein [Anaeromyxobacter sp.]MBL0276474.1 HDOD domain-containing protein [Anaeromyxobacter sp.]